MIIVGLTGSIGSGKSFVGNFLKSKKIPIYHADKEANKILENDNLVFLTTLVVNLTTLFLRR